ncbi:MAG: undecaprenyldiphospho-muramoylpentapeptide beta-N-acetylglucosaminyltransferase [Clostridiales bacterium]|jgi:UDP-N-acetylglucosamine--N-acetylmuramyl-(pentapeptide) pyrophosphoryl-undecaprenol N-acetylglucosamine transferase|nr:undecaprenyldiphospho-muramoylpentapeptide beta-N-acetylglucosaminyltransferase [Clostridiales bacterium]MDR2752035.1 undecaprenyldiphospho-muramoylpentapeptide beta-N-acetylglucosaminyltransferase [Clostridiales bacterium]
MRIVLTGGGTAGHVAPNLALAPFLRELGYEIFYIGSRNGIEKGLVEAEGIPYSGISSGKLRRYFELKNFTDAFRVIKGVGDALGALRKIKPDIVFSKGGFVAAPVCVAAKILRIKVLIHESDMTPGLANRIALPFADKVLVCFPETVGSIKGGKAVLTGTPVRRELYDGSKLEGRRICGFTDQKPVVLVMGGSQGSAKINEVLRSALPELLKKYNIIHLCGKGNLWPEGSRKGYFQLEYANAELPHLMALADLAVSRAGANSITEFLALKKPSLLIPLSLGASRGDQILNAQSYEKQGFSLVLREEDLTGESLEGKLKSLHEKKREMTTAMGGSVISDGTKDVLKAIEEVSKNGIESHEQDGSAKRA